MSEHINLHDQINDARRLFAKWQGLEAWRKIICTVTVTDESATVVLHDDHPYGVRDEITATTAELAVQRMCDEIEDRIMNGGMRSDEVPYWRAVDARERLQKLDRHHVESRLGRAVMWRHNKWRHAKWKVSLKNWRSDQWVAEREDGLTIELNTVADLIALMHLTQWPRADKGGEK